MFAFMKAKYLLLLLLPIKVFGQSNTLFECSFKESAYSFGAISNQQFDSLTQTEKIKFKLRFTEKSIKTSIDNNYNLVREVVIDSMSDEPEWMNLAHRFIYGVNEIKMYDKNGKELPIVSYTNDQLDEKTKQISRLQKWGYHPGIRKFPEFSPNAIQKLNDEGATYELLADGRSKISSSGLTIIIDQAHLSIQHIFSIAGQEDKTITYIYTPYQDKGYLLSTVNSTQKIYTEKGPCLYETDLKNFHDYQISDFGGIMNKNAMLSEKLEIYPNPVSDILNASLNLKNDNFPVSVQIIDPINGNTLYDSNTPDKQLIQVNVNSLNSGQYLLRVVNQNSVLNSYFIKQ